MSNLKESFTRIPNRLIESTQLNVYDKIVYLALAKFNPSFPSYTKIMELTGLSRGRVWKSLRRLEETKVIERYKRGKLIVYLFAFYEYTAEEMDGLLPVHYMNRSVHQANYTSSRHELSPVHHTNPNKTKGIRLI